MLKPYTQEKMHHLFFFYFLIFSTTTIFSQGKKKLEATRVSISPKIDGILNDDVWRAIPVTSGFNMYEPGNEGIVSNKYKTEVQLIYDDNAIYIAVSMLDPDPDTILRQLSQRDEVFVQADLFYVALNTLNDGINETRFYVTSAGTIGDSKSSQNGEDFNYDVVFDCKTSIDTKGWYAEYKIPYNALRFPEIETQDWSVNFYRELKNKNETHSWNFIDNKIGDEKLYNGLITGIKDINPPVRLTFYPFAQGLVSNLDNDIETNITAGLDLKYGISDSFTLDLTLVPDFGQTAFDEVRLNLGPFEQTFEENRAFFTEGVELFNKGEIFFSRRIGGPPSGSIEDLNVNEAITETPSNVNILNAIKVSGRTKKGLGVGFLNSITERTYATITDTVSETIRKKMIEPITNYNVFVLDQVFNGNSSVSLINTNVLRDGSDFRDANVTAGVFSIADKENRFRTSGRAIFSNVNDGEGFKTGFQSEFDIFRTKGNIRYRIGHDFANTTLDINDLGVNFKNNYNNFVAGISYEIFEPSKIFNKYEISLTARHRRLYRPGVQTGNNLSLDSFFFTANRFAFGLDADLTSERKDYFEPRVDGRYFIYAPNFRVSSWISTDFRKKFAFDLRVGVKNFIDDTQYNYKIGFTPRYRISNHFLLIWEAELYTSKNNKGYIDDNGMDVYFGQRDILNLENSLQATYNFDPYKAIDLRFRNFWGTADYSDDLFFLLNQNGTLSPFDYDTSEYNPNTNFNIWNIDLSFRWRFAPGSELTFLYRNQIFNEDDLSNINFSDSLDNLFKQSAQHTFSIRVTYFLDYNNFKNIFKNNS